MKISKLFHYLYATLMFLPIMFFLPSCIYYGFNEHANANITRDTNVNLNQLIFNGKPSSDEYLYMENISFVQDRFVNDTSFHFYIDFLSNEATFDNAHTFYATFEFFPDFLSTQYTLEVSGGNNLDEIYELDNTSYTSLTKFSYYYTDDLINHIEFDFTTTNSGIVTELYIQNVQLFDLTQIFGVGNEPSKIVFEQYLTQEYYEYGVDYEITISKGYNISDSINEAWIHVWDLPFFAWTKNSFISQPFTYITGLFGLQADNPLNYLITWFASVSVIWLVFDIVLYVPNLAHKWLDKGAID